MNALGLCTAMSTSFMMQEPKLRTSNKSTRKASQFASSPRNNAGDFASCRAIVVKKDDPRICFRDSDCYVEQTFDSPIYIVVGVNASHEQLLKVSEMYKYPLTDLVEFRDAIQSS